MHSRTLTITIRINTDFRQPDTLHTVCILQLPGSADYLGPSGELQTIGACQDGPATYIRLANALGAEYSIRVREEGYNRMRRVRGGEAILPPSGR